MDFVLTSSRQKNTNITGKIKKMLDFLSLSFIWGAIVNKGNYRTHFLTYTNTVCDAAVEIHRYVVAPFSMLPILEVLSRAPRRCQE
jgi:hypothetical protein